MQNSLVISWDGPPKNTNKNPYLIATQLGAHNTDIFEESFVQFLMNPGNIKYLYNIKLDEDIRVKRLQPIIERAVRQIDSNFGSHEDSFIGVKNTFKSYKKIVSSPVFSEIECTASSAILISAGPSINDDYWRVLKEIKQCNKVLIVCVDAVLKRCLEKGVYPHFVVSSERLGTERFFDGLSKQDVKEVNFLPTVVATPQSIELWPGKIFFLWRKDFPSAWYPLKRKMLAPFPSVSPTALGAISLLGIKDIALVGQDLCFGPGGVSHCHLGESLNDMQSLMQKNESSRARKIKMPGNLRSQVELHHSWFLMLTDIRRVVFQQSLSVVNTSFDGVKIGNIPFVYLEDWWASRKKFCNEMYLKLPEKNPHEALEWEAFVAKKIKTKIFFERLENELEKYNPTEFIQLPNVKELLKSSMQRAYYTWQNRVFREGKEKHEFTVGFRAEALRAVRDVIEILQN